MSLKQFYGEMDKKDRQIFSEIEKMIINSKMECLAAIPKKQVYDDSELKNKVQSLESKIILAKKNYDEAKQLVDCIVASLEVERKVINPLVDLDNQVQILSDLYNILVNYIADKKQVNLAEWDNLRSKLREIELIRDESCDKANKKMDDWDKKYQEGSS